MTAPARRQSDDPTEYHPTPRWMTLALWSVIGSLLSGRRVLEPCAGTGHISNVLFELGCDVQASDLFTQAEPASLFDDDRTIDEPPIGVGDATSEAFWATQEVDWVATNPPFSLATQILTEIRKRGIRLALLLRVTALEPTDDRAVWLKTDQPSDLILMPRGSFSGGGSDTVTTIWFVWRDPAPRQQPTQLHVITRAEMARFIRRGQ